MANETYYTESPYVRIYPQDTLKLAERTIIEERIERFRGNLTHAAKSLGVGRATIYRKVKEYNISVNQIREVKNG